MRLCADCCNSCGDCRDGGVCRDCLSSPCSKPLLPRLSTRERERDTWVCLELSEARVVGQVLHLTCLVLPAGTQSRGGSTDPNRAPVSSSNLRLCGFDSFVSLGLSGNPSSGTLSALYIVSTCRRLERVGPDMKRHRADCGGKPSILLDNIRLVRIW